MPGDPNDGFPFVGMADYTQFDAEKVSLYVQQRLIEAGLPGIAQGAKYVAYRMANIDGLVEQIISWCVAGRVPSNSVTKTVEWPDGVWQMFKSRWMPEWFVRRFPVKHVRREIATVVNHYFVCPHTMVDARETHVRFMMTARGSQGRPW